MSITFTVGDVEFEYDYDDEDSLGFNSEIIPELVTTLNSHVRKDFPETWLWDSLTFDNRLEENWF